MPFILGALVLAVAAVAYAVGSGKSDNDAAGSGGEIFLESASSTGAAEPFTASVAAPTPSPTVPTSAPPTTSGGGGTKALPAVKGGAPGLYGGTRNLTSCDPEKLVNYLEANPALGRAWASVERIQVSEIRSYVATLTPVLLRTDTRVTNNGFRNGRATPHQSVLQAGTAVLVDQYGVPRVRCYCGNPLLPPIATRRTPTYTGTRWPGFQPSNTTVIVQNTTIINNFVVLNVVDGQLFERPVGGTGGNDTDSTAAPPRVATTTPTPTTPPDDAVGDMTGSWIFTLSRSSGAPECNDTNSFTATIQQRGRTLSGQAEDGTFTGTIDAQGYVTLSATDPDGDAFATITGRVGSTPEGAVFTGSGKFGGGGVSCDYRVDGQQQR
ncbi:MAG: hypothetical protein QOG87_1866 [Actinomycetota bacterium]